MTGPVEAAEALVVQPGDTLVVRVHSHYSRAEVDQCADLIRDRLSPDVLVLVIPAEQFAVIRNNT